MTTLLREAISVAVSAAQIHRNACCVDGTPCCADNCQCWYLVHDALVQALPKNPVPLASRRARRTIPPEQVTDATIIHFIAPEPDMLSSS